MNNIIVSVIIFAIVALSILRVISDKRKGRKCGGCPDAGGCTSHKGASNKKASKSVESKELI